MTTNNLYEALLPYHDMLADISFISESEHVKRYSGRFIGQIGYGVNRSIDIEYPMDANSRECNCGGMVRENGYLNLEEHLSSILWRMKNLLQKRHVFAEKSVPLHQ